MIHVSSEIDLGAHRALRWWKKSPENRRALPYLYRAYGMWIGGWRSFGFQLMRRAP